MRSPRRTSINLTDPKRPKNLFYVAMTQYEKTGPAKYVIAPKNSSIFSRRFSPTFQYKNLRCAETEKYAHVHLLLQWRRGKAICGEETNSRPSPKVATYDLKPEMSAAGITDTW